ncbi:MAG: PrsW family glutamic-type intramembrane protease [Patescibacteria group bacterium]
MITSDPKILAIAFIGGIVPAMLWLWFWLREDRKNPEPRGLLTIVFIVGMVTVLIVLPIQKMVQNFVLSETWELVVWASIEEIMKFLMVLLIVSDTDQADEPTDWPIYLITVALGFAAFENVLFLLKPFAVGDTAVGLLTGQLRFLGSTLLHSIASGTIGISIGLSFYMSSLKKKLYVLIGIISAIALHSAFNFFIMENEGSNFLKVFAFLWIGAIMVLLIFEKLRRMDLSVNKNKINYGQ